MPGKIAKCTRVCATGRDEGLAALIENVVADPPVSSEVGNEAWKVGLTFWVVPW